MANNNKKTDGNKRLIAVVVIVVIVLLGWYFLRSDDREAAPPASEEAPQALPSPAPVEPPAAEAPAPASEEPVEAEPSIVMPPPQLENSDDEVKAAVTDFAPQLTQWLTPQEQVRKLVLLVDLAASGRVPVKNRPLDYSAGRFKVARDGEAIYMDDANYGRAADLIDAVTAIPPEQLARYYQSWRPLLAKAYDELGREQSLDARLQDAIEQVLATEPLRGRVELQQPSVHYTYADPQLESASDISKFLWRLGPDNTEQLQAYLRELQPLL